MNTPPTPPGKKLYYYTSDDQNVEGPITADELFTAVTSGSIPGAVKICKDGTDEWTDFTALPDSELSSGCVADFTKQMEAENAELEAKAKEEWKELEQEIEKKAEEFGKSPIGGIIGGIIFGSIIIFFMVKCTG